MLGVVGTGLAYLLMGTLVGRVGPTRASFITYLIPGVSLVLGVVFKDDHVAALAVAGVALVIAGAMLASRQERRRSRRRPSCELVVLSVGFRQRWSHKLRRCSPTPANV